jgi:hypothetical protein
MLFVAPYVSTNFKTAAAVLEACQLLCDMLFTNYFTIFIPLHDLCMRYVIHNYWRSVGWNREVLRTDNLTNVFRYKFNQT